MLTQNQQEIINSITQEFLSFNEQRNFANKSFNFFDISVLDAEFAQARYAANNANRIKHMVR